MRAFTWPAVAAAGLLVVSCGGGGSDAAAGAKSSGPTTSTASKPAAGAVLEITGTEYSFTPAKAKASAGQTTIRFTNKGLLEHDITITALHVHLTAKPGQSAEATATLTPGTYKSVCTVPGHKESGMHGTLSVS